MADNDLDERKYVIKSHSVSNNVDEIREKLNQMYANIKDSLASYSKIGREEAKKNPVMAILLGSVCLFSAVPVVCFLIFCLVTTAIFLTIFIVAEGAVLLVGMLVLAGFLFFTMLLGLCAGIVTASVYSVFNMFSSGNSHKLE